MALPPQLRAMQVFVEETGRWPSRTAPYAAMPWDDAGTRPRRRIERKWLDFTERELATWLQNQRQHASDRRRRLLDEQLPGWDEHIAGIERQSFDERVEELRQARVDIEAGRRKSLGESLRKWVTQQEQAQHTLTAEQRKALDEAYPQWVVRNKPFCPPNEQRFDQRIADLVEFRERTGTWPSTRSPLKAERSLAVWLRDTRRYATPERRARLSAAVPGWDVTRAYGGTADRFDDLAAARRMRELRHFVEKHNRAPSRFSEDPTERKLGAWVRNHLNRDDRRRDKIVAALGDHYTPRSQQWHKRLAELEAFVQENGHLPRRSENWALYSWLHRQRTGATPERRAELDRRVPGWDGSGPLEMPRAA